MIDTERLRCNIIRNALSGNISRHQQSDTPVESMLESINEKK